MTDSAAPHPVAEEHLHWGPPDDSIETYPVITYHHRRLGEQATATD